MSRPRTVTFEPVIVSPSPAAGLAAAELDQRRAGVARLGEAVDQHRPGDRRQGGERGDRLHALARDGEVDRDGLRAWSAVGVEDRLPERAGAGVGRGGHREESVGDVPPGPGVPPPLPNRRSDSP